MPPSIAGTGAIFFWHLPEPIHPPGRAHAPTSTAARTGGCAPDFADIGVEVTELLPPAYDNAQEYYRRPGLTATARRVASAVRSDRKPQSFSAPLGLHHFVR
jgi:hypothetical protein